MKMKYLLLKHSDTVELQDGRILPKGELNFPRKFPAYIRTQGEKINIVEIVKAWQGDTLLYQRMDFEKETPYCDNCDTIDDVCFRPDHYEKGHYTAYGEWECGKCHTQDGLGVLRQCTVCEGEFNSKEGECVCEVCMDKGGIA